MVKKIICNENEDLSASLLKLNLKIILKKY